MQSICVVAIPQFYVLTNLFSIIYYIQQLENYFEERLSLTLGLLQFLVCLIILGLTYTREQYKTKKLYILFFVFIFLVFSFYLIIAKFRQDCLVLILLQILSVGMIFSFVILSNKQIGIAIQIQIYIVTVALDFMPFYLYYFKNKFMLNRAISIVGCGGVEISTLLLCIICQINPQKRLADEVHLIVGFYIFFELFVSCSYVAECANQEVDSYLIGLTILKISNLFMDLTLYSFIKLNYPENQRKEVRIDNDNLPQKIQFNSLDTRDTISDCSQARKKSVMEQIDVTRKPCPSIEWILYLLRIY